MKKVFSALFILFFLVGCAPAFAKEIHLYCDGYQVNLRHNGNGPISGTISFEDGSWNEIFSNNPSTVESKVSLINTTTLRVAMLGTRPDGMGLQLFIYRNSLDYDVHTPQNSLRCRLSDGK